MSWAKLDDGFHCHAKVIATEVAALGLYALGLSYAAQQRKNGFLAAHVARHLARGDDTLPQQLVANGLWKDVPGGYAIHDYLKYNPSAKQLEKQAKLSARRQREYRERNGVTRPLVDHSPQRAGTGEPSSVVSLSSEGRGSGGGKPWRRLPSIEVLTPLRAVMADEAGLSAADAALEWAKLADFEFSKAHRDVDATWRNWCREAVRRGPRANGSAFPLTSAAAREQRTVQAAKRVIAELRGTP